MTILDNFRLDGKVALITGGSKGIGLAIAKGFAEAGADIVISARHEDELQQAAKAIADAAPRRVEYLATDMARREESDQLARWALQAFGKIDIVVNNAGSNKPQTLVDTTDDAWDYILELNFSSCMRLSRALVPRMIEQRWGRVIHISSVMALASNPGRGLYSGTKAALIAMARGHALELGPFGITVNCIAPGPILTDLPMNLLNDQQKKTFAERTALKRWGDAADIVGPALLLASEAGRNITGAVIVSDGGMLCRSFD
jgi:NAD(P)-dependent dehydrogenase (short-subunit alcohol dehydrogenase family)